MEIVKWDEDMVGLLPNIYKIVSTTLASNKGAIYLVLDEGRLNIFARNGGQGVYVSNKGESVEVSSYLFDKDYKLKSFGIGDKQYAYINERVNSIDKNTGIERSLLLAEMPNSSVDGLVTYTQYDKNRDIECEIQFEHRYFKSNNEERGRIYPYRLDYVYSLMIDEGSKGKHVGAGLIGKGHEYYTSIRVSPEYYSYYIVALKEAGLLEYLKQGAESILGRNYITRYVKGVYMGRDGIFKTLWPLGKMYTEEDIQKVMKENGFNPEIPEDLIDLYNDQNELVNKIKELLGKIKVVDEAKDQEKFLIYSLRP